MVSITVSGVVLLTSIATARATTLNGGLKVIARGGCNDNCARAVAHTDGHYSTRGGAFDCSAYLVTTVTPATSTITRYATLSFTPTVTAGVTATVTETTTPTATQTLLTTSLAIPLAKRAPQIPDYAVSSCTGDVASRYSSACACLGLTSTVITAPTPLATTTVTVSVTSAFSTLITTVTTNTATSTAPAVTTTSTNVVSCDAGLDYAFYSLSPGSERGELPYNDQFPYNPYTAVFKVETAIKGLIPDFIGKTSAIGAPDNLSDGAQGNVGAAAPACNYADGSVVPSIYGQTLPSTHSDFIAINQQGYFVPQEKGSYVFSARADDSLQVWLGDKAVSAYTAGNADWEVDALSMNSGVQKFVYVVAQAGSYIPFRVVFANAQGCARFYLSITSPSGRTVLGPSTTYQDSGSSFVRSCGVGSVAPPLPAFS